MCFKVEYFYPGLENLFVFIILTDTSQDTLFHHVVFPGKENTQTHSHLSGLNYTCTSQKFR